MAGRSLRCDLPRGRSVAVRPLNYTRNRIFELVSGGFGYQGTVGKKRNLGRIEIDTVSAGTF